jgi:hypothetical protein
MKHYSNDEILEDHRSILRRKKELECEMRERGLEITKSDSETQPSTRPLIRRVGWLTVKDSKGITKEINPLCITHIVSAGNSISVYSLEENGRHVRDLIPISLVNAMKYLEDFGLMMVKKGRAVNQSFVRAMCENCILMKESAMFNGKILLIDVGPNYQKACQEIFREMIIIEKPTDFIMH